MYNLSLFYQTSSGQGPSSGMVRLLHFYTRSLMRVRYVFSEHRRWANTSFTVIIKPSLDPWKTNIGPGVLACATRGGGRSEAGHCFHLLSFFFLFFLFLRLLLFTHFGESPVRENLFPPIFWHN